MFAPISLEYGGDESSLISDFISAEHVCLPSIFIGILFRFRFGTREYMLPCFGNKQLLKTCRIVHSTYWLYRRRMCADSPRLYIAT